MQGSLPAGWLAFTGRELNPLDRDEGFQITSSSLPGLFLAQRPKTFRPSSLSAPPSRGITAENSSQKRSSFAASEYFCLEPISKSFEEDEESGELHEAKEVLRIKFPADKNATLPSYPSEEAFDQPGISPKPSSILRGALAAIGSVRRDHLDAVFA
jgi:hypothetical protein